MTSARGPNRSRWPIVLRGFLSLWFVGVVARVDAGDNRIFDCNDADLVGERHVGGSGERTGELLQAPPGFMLVVSYNPGYQNLLKNLKPSTRQRFVALGFDYPVADVEQRIIEKEAHASPELATRLVRLATALRRLTDQDLEETVSTRLLVVAGRLIVAGLDERTACRAAIVDALTDDHDTAAALDEVVQAVWAPQD